MINNTLLERYGNSIYPTFVVVEKNNRCRIQFLPGFEKGFHDTCKLYAGKFVEIMKNNPRKVESVVMDGIKHYFVTERWREQDNIFYAVQFIYSIIEDNERIFHTLNFGQIIYDACNVLPEQQMSDESLTLIKNVKSREKSMKFIFDFLCNRFDGFFENEKSSYFYKINDVIKYTVENYFDNENCPCRFRVNYIESDMYTQMNLNLFVFFTVNLLLILSKYSLRTVCIDFENNVTTLDTKIQCQLYNAFLLNNRDIVLGTPCEIKSSHPAFMDFEFLKHIANEIGVAIEMNYEKLDIVTVKVTVSKTEIVFKNLLRAGEISGQNTDIPIYTVDISELI